MEGYIRTRLRLPIVLEQQGRHHHNSLLYQVSHRQYFSSKGGSLYICWWSWRVVSNEKNFFVCNVHRECSLCYLEKVCFCTLLGLKE